MEDRAELAALQPAQKIGRRNGLGVAALVEILALGPVDLVGDSDVADAALVQAGDQVRTDETGAAGDQDHAQSPRRPADASLCRKRARGATAANLDTCARRVLALGPPEGTWTRCCSATPAST